MAIGSAIQNGRIVFVYNERGQSLFNKPVGPRPGDGLHGFTALTVSIRNGSLIFTYDENGRTLYNKPAR
jgi:hypothetical protein